MTTTPFTLPVGTSADLTGQTPRRSDGAFYTAADPSPFTGAEAVTATLHAGAARAAVASPVASWVSAPAVTWQVRFLDTDTAALAPGDYWLWVRAAASGTQTAPLFEGPVVLTDSPPSAGASPRDLVALSVAASELAASLPADATALQACLSAASRAVQKYCGRDFVQATYDECYDAPKLGVLVLRQYPVNAVARLTCDPRTLLTITNTDPATNQRALAQLTTTGDVDSGLTVTGLTLTRVASGVTTADASTVFATYPTLAAVAAHVNGLGGGWSATAASGYGLWASADLRAVQGGQNALGTGAAFSVHATDLANWTLDERTGLVRLGSFGAGSFGAGSGFLSAGGTGAGTAGGYQSVRCVYTAGYAAVPPDVVQACLVTTQAMLYDLQTVRRYQSETAKDWSYTLAGPAHSGLPDAAVRLLQPWRAFRRY